MSINAESLKSSIQSLLLQMAISRHELIKHARILADMGVSTKDSNVCFGECLEAITGSYLVNLCEKVSAHHSNGTPAKVSLDPNLYGLIFGSRRRREFAEQFMSHKDGDLEADKLLIATYLAEVKFDAIAESVNEQIENLEQNGLCLLATEIIGCLNLKFEGGFYEPYTKNGRVICISRPMIFHYSHDAIKKVSTLNDALRIIETESGLSFGAALAEYTKAINGLCWKSDRIASRSVFGKGGHLEVHCFNEKHEYRFSLLAFEALIAFMMLNGEAEAADRIIKKTGLQETA